MTPQELNTVMCVNDNDITLFIFKRTLNKSNFKGKIVERSNGLEALKYCKALISDNGKSEENYPRVIFLDLHMPVMDGWEFMDKFAEEIWPYFKDTRIIITSQSVDSAEYLRAREYPFVADFLNTIVTTEYLNRVHEALLNGYDLQAK